MAHGTRSLPIFERPGIALATLGLAVCLPAVALGQQTSAPPVRMRSTITRQSPGSFDPSASRSFGSASVLRPGAFVAYDAFPFSPLFGYPAVNLGFPQPLGHQITFYGANGYSYRPVTDLGAFYDRALAALRASQYAQVLIEIDPVLSEMPEDGDSWMLRALALFGQGMYGKSATALHMAMRLLPQEQWGRPVVKLRDYFSSEAEFTARLRALEAYVHARPGEGAGHFLLGYFYGYRGDAARAAQELRTALRLVTGDVGLANALLAPLQAAPAAGADERPRPALDEADGPREF